MVSRTLILASRSPQRRALLEALGLDFEVRDPEVQEEGVGEPRELVIRNATRKAEAVATDRPDALVIAGDTEVVIDGEVLGQPEDEAQARAHLERLSGAKHHVLGGLALVGPGGEEPRTGVDVSTVAFRVLEEPLLHAYLASGEWRGRAGSYAIQGLGSALVDIVRGDVSNVIGLPVGLLLRLAPELVGDG
ncbi:MAG TPA: nucleoside triphosphate pyrophosphatase [Solirubrobacterales bacterium]|nr:nucleoside triphosphate pyrophosphatase [Solirubrobacterales bacterium]